MVLEHPKLMLTESKQMTESLRTFYKASSDFISMLIAYIHVAVLLEHPKLMLTESK